ncbi:hypothetical protein CK203_098811 [Vitis vinifera]|uniref:Uncharacterized protein n=1 Tax=Vitis vinifera TaxID=29760 RepID=A0A438D455_VITVI|nr:hypothetical protein CK203_098811 [Vitis vinifera]
MESCFFRIDSKSFEVRIVWSKGRGEVQIVEKGKGFRRWIKASRGIVVWFLKSIEACCKWRGKKLFKEDEIFHYYPRGFDLLGWDLFRSKLKELARIGDGSKYEAEDSGTYGGGNETSLVKPGLSYVDAIKRKAKGRSEEVWVEVGNEAYTSTLKDLRRCLVGRWNIENEAAHDLRVVEIWANTHWSFSGQGSRCLNGVRLSLDWWAPTVGCSRREFQRDVSWVRIPGLPLQFWSMEFFKMVGDACGGFVDVDEETKKSSYRKGARILVKNNGKEVANRLKIQREGEPESRASIQQEEGGCESRKVVHVKGIRYGEGNSEAAVGDRVSGWGLRIPEEKASRIGCEGPGSLQEEAGLVKETLDMTGNGSAEVVRRDGKLIFGGGRKLVDGLGGQMSKWAEMGGPSGMRSPVAIGPNFLLKERAWAYPKRRGNGLSSEKEAPPLDQGRRESPLESHSPGMFPRSIAFGGVSEEFYGLSSPSISGMGVSVEYPLAWQSEETCEDPLEAEVPLRMILKDGRSFTLPEGEKGKRSNPLRRGVIRKPNESKRGTLSASRKDRELKKLVSTINYDELVGREAEEGELGRQITMVPYEA